ncbi:MAG: SoxR reducing system RseC family protein [Methanosarcinales archaeon]|nr:SoxR reducing system RseC family protein [Methanosarcinales archaeon]
MLSDQAENIIKDVKNIRTKGIKDLLKKYPERSQRDFIQKYAETEIAVRSMKVAFLAYMLALILFVVTVGLSIAFITFTDSYVQNFGILIIGTIVIFVGLIYYFIKILSEKVPLQDIIIAIEDANKLKAN